MTATTKDFPAVARSEVTYDHLAIRCPRLGGQVTFAYCRREGGALPCPRIIVCWQDRFPVGAFLKNELSEEDWERWTHQRPKEKVITLLELIEAAKVRLQSEEDLTSHKEGEET